MKYNIVGYGSLLNHKSLKATIKNKHFKQVIIKGYKRIFDLIDNKNKSTDILNITISPKSFFNGVLFSVDNAELKKIKIRELDYNLEEAWAYDFVTKEKLCKCIICVDPFIDIDNQQSKPNKNYFILCREAAYQLSKEFGHVWDQTTFTSSGENIEKWIKNNPQYNTIG